MTLIIWGLTCALWSTVWVFIKVGVSDVPPLTFAAYRLFVLMKKHARDLDPGIITAGQMLAALLPLSAFAFIVEGNPVAIRWTPTAAVALLYLALFGSITATWLNYWLLSVAVVLDVFPAAVTSFPSRARRT